MHKAPRLFFATVAMAVLAAVTGCVGIPTAGSVTEGQTIREEADFPVVPLPSGPRKDATQQEMLTDFMQAATSPEDNYAIARQFLTPATAESWNPNVSVLIREGAATLEQQGEGAIDYSVVTGASVDAFGLYREEREASTQVLRFTFTQVDGQWRINGLQDGTVISRDGFESVFAQHALYFFDSSYRYLVPDVRWFPVRSSISTRIVTALLEGQAAWPRQGATLTAFPQGTQLATAPVQVESGRASIDLTDEAADGTTPTDRARMRQQLVASLGSVSVSSAKISVRGVDLPDADASLSAAILAPAVDAAPLIRRDDQFGFATGQNIASIAGLSRRVIEVDASTVVLSRDRQSAAAGAANGVFLLTANAATLVDSRPELAAPSIDHFGYVWSVPKTEPTAVRVFVNGESRDVVTNLSGGGEIVSIAVSRDGARLLIYRKTDAGTRLQVAGILRDDGIPTALGELIDLPTSADTPLGATWVDDRTIATLVESVSGARVTLYPLGGPRQLLGVAQGGAAIVGGNGVAELRVLSTDGVLLQRRASGWQSTGIAASLLATQQ